MSGIDHATRQRLIQAAAPLFALRGFKKVTVREICRNANANIAAINYHFRDKRGLYREVLQMAVGVMCEVTEAAQQAGARSAEEKLRVFIHLFLQRLVDEGNDVWLQRLINREIVDPTPTVDALEVITEQAVRPRIEFLCKVVADLMKCPATDVRVLECVINIQGQCLMALPNPILDRVRPRIATPADIVRRGDLIAEFSLAGIRAVGRQRVETRARVAGAAAR